MIAVKEAIDIFEKKYPELTIIKAAIYDNKYYLFVGVKDPAVPDYDDPYYAVDKNTGKISNFTPAFDIPKFHEAFREHEIDLEELGYE